MLAVIDNYDSFTYNLVQYLGELGADVRVFRNDAISVDELEALQPERLLLSPGPGRPEDAGILMSAIDRFAGQIPMLGVCLGHQAIGQYFGGRIVLAGEIMHGKVSPVYHDGQGVFEALASPCTQTRYHSLVIDKATLPECLAVTAWTETPGQQVDEIMAVRHRELPVEGVQFHPESISSTFGHDMLRRFLQQPA